MSHAQEIGAAIRQLRRAMLHAGFKPDDFGLAIRKPRAFDQLRTIVLSDPDLSRYRVAVPDIRAEQTAWEGVAVVTTYDDQQ